MSGGKNNKKKVAQEEDVGAAEELFQDEENYVFLCKARYIPALVKDLSLKIASNKKDLEKPKKTLNFSQKNQKLSDHLRIRLSYQLARESVGLDKDKTRLEELKKLEQNKFLPKKQYDHIFCPFHPQNESKFIDWINDTFVKACNNLIQSDSQITNALNKVEPKLLSNLAENLKRVLAENSNFKKVKNLRDKFFYYATHIYHNHVLKEEPSEEDEEETELIMVKHVPDPHIRKFGNEELYWKIPSGFISLQKALDKGLQNLCPNYKDTYKYRNSEFRRAYEIDVEGTAYKLQTVLYDNLDVADLLNTVKLQDLQEIIDALIPILEKYFIFAFSYERKNRICAINLIIDVLVAKHDKLVDDLAGATFKNNDLQQKMILNNLIMKYSREGMKIHGNQFELGYNLYLSTIRLDHIYQTWFLNSGFEKYKDIFQSSEVAGIFGSIIESTVSTEFLIFSEKIIKEFKLMKFDEILTYMRNRNDFNHFYDNKKFGGERQHIWVSKDPILTNVNNENPEARYSIRVKVDENKFTLSILENDPFDVQGAYNPIKQNEIIKCSVCSTGEEIHGLLILIPGTKLTAGWYEHNLFVQALCHFRYRLSS